MTRLKGHRHHGVEQRHPFMCCIDRRFGSSAWMVALKASLPNNLCNLNLLISMCAVTVTMCAVMVARAISECRMLMGKSLGMLTGA